MYVCMQVCLYGCVHAVEVRGQTWVLMVRHHRYKHKVGTLYFGASSLIGLELADELRLSSLLSASPDYTQVLPYMIFLWGSWDSSNLYPYMGSTYQLQYLPRPQISIKSL